MITTLLFDLDGTLLNMDQEEFVRHYFHTLTTHMQQYGYNPKQLAAGIWKWVQAMYANDGKKSNAELFWQEAQKEYGPKIMEDLPLFEEYYHGPYQNISQFCPPDPKKSALVQELKQKYRLVLATNPLFPSIATRSRLRWAGMNEEDFDLITTYENFHAAKPNPAYFQEVLDQLGLQPLECLMIGNDVLEDGGALKAGIPLFLLEDFLINTQNLPIDSIPHGSIDDLLRYLQQNAGSNEAGHSENGRQSEMADH